MKDSKIIAFGGILTGFSVLLQIMPAVFSELFVAVTILSALPVYITCRLSPIAGFSSFTAAALMIFIISPHEGIFFIFTNGIIGLCLGICNYYFVNRFIAVFMTSFSLTISLNVLPVLLGINVFGVEIPFSLLLESALIFVFSIVYSFAYMQFAKFIYTRILSLMKIDI